MGCAVSLWIKKFKKLIEGPGRSISVEIPKFRNFVAKSWLKSIYDPIVLGICCESIWRSNPNKTLLASGICDSVPAFSKKELRYRLTGSIIWKSPCGGILGAILAKIPNFRDFRVKPLLKFVRDPTVLINGTESQIPLANKVLFRFDLQNALTTNS